jgi:thiosulfate reductase cytochrome b subunit
VDPDREFLVYLGLNLAPDVCAEKLLPISFKSLAADPSRALRGGSGMGTSRYNAVQKFAYLVVIVDIVLVILSGLAIWSPFSSRCCAR